MFYRSLHNSLTEALERQAAVVLLGPRQVGKTTLALQVTEDCPSIYLDLESPEDLQKLSDPLLYLRSQKDKLVILDEIQRAPDLFLVLRGLIDEYRRQGNPNGHFLLLGSASLDLLQQSSESLAGRIAQLELTPFTAAEVGEDEERQLWLRGGFPESFLAKKETFSYKWRKDFIKSYLERDIPQFGSRLPAETLRRFWTMLAHVQGGLLNAAQLALSLGVSVQSVLRYLDLLVDLLLVRRLSPYHTNVGKRLVKSPKVFIRDTGLLHALLGLPDQETLLGHPILGASFETFVIENCLNCAGDDVHGYFYRSAAGAEIDLVLEFADQTLWAVEVKHSLSPKLQRGFFHAREDLQPERSFVIYPGKERYPLREGVEAICLKDFLGELAAAT